jgi:hypothetical protein
MKGFLTILLFIISAGQISCTDSKKSIQSVTLDFACFKSPYTSFTIDFSSKILTCKNFGYEPKVNEQTNELIAVYKRDYKLQSEAADELREMFSKYVPDITTRREEEDVVDGGGFQISYVRSAKDTIKLTVVNPTHTDTYKTDILQIDKFFKVAHTVVTDSPGINTLDETYEVYFSGPPIRKVSENPLTYKIWGNFSGCREDNKELLDFLNGLSKEKCVIVETGKRKLSYCLTEVIAAYSLRGNIYFVSDGDLPWLWTELHALKKQVFDAKKQNKTVEETPGNAVFLNVYLRDSAIFNKWLDIPKEELFKSKLEIEKNCRYQ